MNFLENIILQQVVQKLGWTLIHFLWEGTAAALLLAILLRLMRKSTANLRYVATCLTLGLMAFLPIVTFPLVSATVPDPAAIDQQKTAAVLESTVAIPMAEVPAVELPTSNEGLGIRQSILWKDRVIGALGVSLPYVVFGWLVGVFGLSIWHLGGWAQLQRFRRKMVKQVSERVRLRTRHLAEKMGVKRIVTIMESALVQVPTVVGWLKPVILLPASALSGLSGEQIEAILAHELAHIKRLDYLVNMLQTIVEILGFYHPAVWWVSRKIRAERENCCDDMAVSISGDRVCYARALTTMEQIRAGGPGLAVAASGGSLFERIRRLIGRDSAKDGRLSWLPSVVAILLVTASVILVSCSMSGRTVEKFDVQVEKEKVKLAPTSYIDADGRIVDKTDYRFVDDPEVIGGWKSVDFVRDIDEFDPTKRSWEGDLYLNNLIFGEGGNIAGNALTWTKGLVLGDDTASKYIIREIDGSTYMFFEWKSGDYTIRHMRPHYYVLMKVLTESLKYEPIFGKKAYIPPTSTINEKGHIVDKIDYPFVNDPEVIGGWKSVDFVRDIDEFDPTKRSWKGELYLNKLIFEEGGDIAGIAPTWTKGLVLGDDTASKYIIREIDGSTYMFFEWKSGDYTIRHMRPHYLVLMKVLAESLKYEPIFGKKAYIPPTSTINEKGYIVDKIDYPFVNDPQVIGTWKAIDCVDEIEQFKVNEKQWKSREGELFLHEMIFEKNGRLISKNDNEPRGYPETWTKGLIIYENNDTKQASKYIIKEIGGSTYMFYEWKSGDYTFRHMKPSYYVLRKASFDTASCKKDGGAEGAKGKKGADKSDEIRRKKIIEARNNPQIIHEAAYSLFEKIKNADYDYFLSVDWGQFPIVEYYSCYRDYPVLIRWICKTFKENPIVSIELGDASFSEGWPRIYYKLILKDGAILEGDLHFEYHFYHSDEGRWYGIHGHSYDGPETPYKIHGIDWHLQDEPIKRPETQSADSSDAPQILTSGYILSVPPEMPQLKEIILNDRSKAQMITPEKLEEFLDVVRTTPGARVIAAPKLLTNNGEDGEIRTENAVGFDSIKIDIKNTVGVDRKTVHLELDFEYSVSMGQDLKSTKAETTAAVLSEHAIAIAGGVPVDGQKVILLVKPQVLERRFSKTGIVASCKLKSEEEVSKEDKIEVQARFLLVPTDANALKDFCEDEGIAFPKGQEDSDFASVLNGEQAEKLLKLAQAEPDSKLLAAPNVKVLDGEQATMSLQRTIMYSNPDSNQAEPKKLPVGTIIEVKPILEDGGEKIMLEIEFEQRNFLGFENEVPQVHVAKGQGRVKMLNGQTVLLGGLKLTEEIDDRKVEKTFLCLVKVEKAEVANNDKD